MNFSIEADQAIEWTTRLVAFYVMLDSAEKLSNFREFGDGGLLNWNFLRENLFFASRSSAVRQLFDVFFGFRVWLFLSVLRGTGALYLLFFPQRNLFVICALAFLFAVGSAANLRNAPYGAETENRFSLVIIGALFLRAIAPTEFITEISLWFIALQSCLSYLTAGVAKLFNKNWRGGDALLNIANSPTLSVMPKLAVFFNKHRSVGKSLTWLTLAVECLFPLVLLIGQPWYLFFLIWGSAFHLANAVLLRLNKFFWVWIATYPAIVFAAQK